MLFIKTKLKYWFSQSNGATSAYIEILESLDKGDFPTEIDWPSNQQAHIIRELIEGDYLSGDISSWYDGYQITNLRFKPTGRIFLESLKESKYKKSISYKMKISFMAVVAYLIGLLSNPLSEYVSKWLSLLN